MTPDYQILHDLITSGTKTLRDLEERIKKAFLRGYVTSDEESGLMELAATQAAPPDVPENTEMAVRLGMLEAALVMLTGRVDALEKGNAPGKGDDEDSEEPGETPAGPPAGVEAWVPTKAYMYGATVWNDGKVWVSQEGNNRFTPGVEAWAWKVVT